ncbi:MAG: hypothetical protein J0L69_13300 [Bacteroidetes bacterium]|nr:hypothetical protein [Bacteroidota bacterium]
MSRGEARDGECYLAISCFVLIIKDSLFYLKNSPTLSVLCFSVVNINKHITLNI